MKTQLSVVVPVFNEEKNIPQLIKALTKTLSKITKDYEVIFVDDGSSDQSLQKIKLFRRRNPRIKYLQFSRNFGHMSAVDAGLEHAKGEKVVLMDADMQDPPAVIEKMYKISQKGFDIVYGIKQKRKESLFRRLAFTYFYRLLNKMSPYKMPLDAGTFSLIDKKVVTILTSLPERNKYFSGLRAWTGFSQTGVIYERGKRHSGEQASLRRLFKLALDGMFSFSYVPLRFASFVGFAFSGIAFFLILLVIILRLLFGVGLIGWASTMITILLVSGIQLLTLGVIGEYLARIYDEVKGRPKYIIQKKAGIK